MKFVDTAKITPGYTIRIDSLHFEMFKNFLEKIGLSVVIFNVGIYMDFMHFVTFKNESKADLGCNSLKLKLQHIGVCGSKYSLSLQIH